MTTDNPVIVWANPESPLTVENPSVAVWTLERLPDELGNLDQNPVLAEEVQNKIVNKLTQLIERQKEAK